MRKVSWLLQSPGWVATAALLAISCVLLLFPAFRPLLFFPDDAFFYMKTARNLGAGLGQTFDGVNPTNGFHPLYLLLLSAASLVKPIVGQAGIVATFTIDTALAALWFFAVTAFARRVDYSIRMQFMLLAGLFPLTFHQDFGTEANLLLVLAWAYLWLIARYDGTWKKALLAGAVGALACLARLDAVLFVGVVAAATLLAELIWAKRSIRPLFVTSVLFVGPSICVLLGLAAYNDFSFGHPSTISSSLKTGWRTLEIAAGAPLFGSDLWPLAGANYVAHAIAIAGILRFLIRPTRPHLLPAALGVWLILYSLIMTLFLRGGMQTWYFTLPFSVAAFIGVDLVRAFLDKPKARLGTFLTGVVGLCSLLVTGVMIEYWQARGRFLTTAIELSHWMSQNLPAGTRVYQVDQSGIVGYLSGQAVINGDGLVNSWDYQTYLRSGQLDEFLRDVGAEYVIWDGYRGEEHISIPVTLWSAPELHLRFRTEPEIAARFGRHVLLRLDPANIIVE